MLFEKLLPPGQLVSAASPGGPDEQKCPLVEIRTQNSTDSAGEIGKFDFWKWVAGRYHLRLHHPTPGYTVSDSPAPITD